MKKIISKIWFPLCLILLLGLETFGMDIIPGHNNDIIANLIKSHSGITKLAPPPVKKSKTIKLDTVIYHNTIFTKYRNIKDTKYLDSTIIKDSNLFKPKTVTHKRDTIKRPDSLRLTDPFRYKYYFALNDSLTHQMVRDSLRKAKNDSTIHKLDSIYYADSAIVAKAKFKAWYNNLSKEEKKKYDFEQEMKIRRKQIDSLMKIKDKEKAIKDSIIKYTPRILETFALPDSMQYKRIIMWHRDKYFSDIHLHKVDTGYNHYYHDYPFMQKDINASYLGISGSAVQTYDYFKRDSREDISFYKAYEVYSFCPSNLPMYNTKTPYTELAYWGTLFSSSQVEENNIHILTSQNILPALNITLNYDRHGANGILANEGVDNRTFYAAGNYLGKKYLAHFGYIYNKIDQKENGGIINSFWIKDTTVGPRDISVNLNKASNKIKKHIFFVDEMYRIPFSFLKHLKDSSKKTAIDSIDKNVTTAYIGHSSDISFYRKIYTDEIRKSDSTGRNFYHKQFNINPLSSRDSLHITKIENKIFLKLQPWSDDAIVSSVNVGLGNRIKSFYLFNNSSYFTKTSNTTWNSTYVYGGAEGKFSKYFSWNALGYYTFLGDEINDTGLFGNVLLNIFPFRRHKKSPITIEGKFEATTKNPDFYENHLYTNHYKWDNDFNKIIQSKVYGGINIPLLKLKMDIGYSIIKNYIYFNNDGMVSQEKSAISVAKAGLSKDFMFGILHFNNRFLLQLSSNQKVLPLPLLAANLRWYIQFNINAPDRKARAMQMQLGANLAYNTAWYAPAYNPVISRFHTQNKEKFGNCPYIDLFVNMQWKRACIFIKLVNANMGWPSKAPDYFSASGYLRPQRTIKFGIFWPFYIQPHINPPMESSGSGGSGNNFRRR